MTEQKLAIVAWLGRSPASATALHQQFGVTMGSALGTRLARFRDEGCVVGVDGCWWMTAEGAARLREQGIRAWHMADLAINEDDVVTQCLDEGCSFDCVHFGEEQIP